MPAPFDGTVDPIVYLAVVPGESDFRIALSVAAVKIRKVRLKISIITSEGHPPGTYATQMRDCCFISGLAAQVVPSPGICLANAGTECFGKESSPRKRLEVPRGAPPLSPPGQCYRRGTFGEEDRLLGYDAGEDVLCPHGRLLLMTGTTRRRCLRRRRPYREGGDPEFGLLPPGLLDLGIDEAGILRIAELTGSAMDRPAMTWTGLQAGFVALSGTVDTYIAEAYLGHREKEPGRGGQRWRKKSEVDAEFVLFCKGLMRDREGARVCCAAGLLRCLLLGNAGISGLIPQTAVAVGQLTPRASPTEMPVPTEMISPKDCFCGARM
ncbi:hypothetical protein AK812_SmicGene39706 [Symbiodinium microadriaticum]|uniref:Uncharacterized protein n=1 Tax=Symbiodinium microadriaticum TaxID=2951 RepID=A0A1Q9CAJ7_SYMMI|nr:hypothetical protein AK812_SmicGene39706 [Symbiodinium microadriaticum]